MKNQYKNYLIYLLMVLIFGVLIWKALEIGIIKSNSFTTNTSLSISEAQATTVEQIKNFLKESFSNPLIILLIQILTILITVRFFGFFFNLIKQPVVVGEIVAGIILGPSVLGHFLPNASSYLFPPESLGKLELLSQIGLILFMFVIGMEVDFKVLKSKISETLIISHAGILVPFFLGVVASFWVYEEYAINYTSFLPFALFIGISMSITAFPVLARILVERGLSKTPLGTLVIASAANDDVTAWCLLAFVIAVAKAGSIMGALYTLIIILVYLIIMFTIVRPILSKIGQSVVNNETISKSFVAFLLLILIVSATFTEILGVHALFGAFIAGVVMPPNMRFRKKMMDKIEDVALIFFLPLFFAYTGLHTHIGLINTPQLIGVCCFMILVAVVGKFGGCAIAAKLVGESWKNSFTIGILMNTRGLMELIALNIGYEMGILPPPIFVILVLMALITTFMTTPLLHLISKIKSSHECTY